MTTAEIITIGTELLLGETVDTNTRYIARTLRDIGVNIYRTSTIGDNLERIAQIIREGMSRAEIIITTGGLGPTVDDNTRDAIASALDVNTEFHEELWQQIQERFRRYGREPTENNKRQAYIPKNAISLENPVGTAPAFIVEVGKQSIIALPGVPREMEYLMEHEVLPYLKKRFKPKGVIKSRVLHTSGVGESQIDDRIGDLERLSNPTVGLAAHSGQVDIRITAKADTEVDADNKIQQIQEIIHQRLDDWIYGVNGDTLEQTALDIIAARNWNLVVIESGLQGQLTRRLAQAKGPFIGSNVLSNPPGRSELVKLTKEFVFTHTAQVGLGVMLRPGKVKQALTITLVTPSNVHDVMRTFGGPPQLAVLWSVNISLDLLRRI
ncbi:MAG: molybdopterin-binding protein [Anaerolineales bacterium]|jgi:competence/damage-inducible protein CinA-like protein